MLNDTQRRDRELAVYTAVLELIAQGQDLATLRVQQIAAAADIGKGTVYEYFPSKEAILRGLTAYCVDTELDRLAANTAPCQTLDALLDALLAQLVDLAQNRAGIYRIIAAALARSPHAGACGPDPALAARLQALLHTTLARLRANGQLDPALNEEYCFYALSAAAVSCIVLLTVAAGNSMEPQAVLTYTRLLLRRALCPPNG